MLIVCFSYFQTQIILSLGHLVVALLCTMVGYWYGVSVRMGVANTTILTLLGFFGGYMMCAVTMKVGLSWPVGSFCADWL